MTGNKMTLGGGSAIAMAMAAGILTATPAVPGAWETFPTQANADAWQVYDFSDGINYLPGWNGSEAGGKYIWRAHTGDQPLIFFADNLPGAGALAGDFNAANVGAVSVEVYVEDLDEFEYLDCNVYANGPAGLRFYYSQAYYYDDLEGDGWQKLEFSFSRPWFYLENGAFIQVADNTAFLSDVKEVGFSFYPRLGTTFNAYAALDDVKLEPRLAPENLATALSSGQFQLSFRKGAAVSYQVEKMSDTTPFTWTPVAGQTGITGSGPHLFATPATQGREIFRVVSQPVYTPVVTAP